MVNLPANITGKFGERYRIRFVKVLRNYGFYLHHSQVGNEMLKKILPALREGFRLLTLICNLCHFIFTPFGYHLVANGKQPMCNPSEMKFPLLQMLIYQKYF
jgi:hypothetical protein